MLQGQGYIDDSGSHGRGLFVLAGYVMPVPQWGLFSDEWEKELKREPRITYFKLHEAIRKEGEFLGMSEGLCDRKIHNLAMVIRRHEPICLATSVEWDNFRAIFGERLPRELNTPYCVLFYRILELMVICQQDMVEVEPYEKVDFVFDEQGEIGRRAIAFYGQVKDVCPPEIQKMLGATPVMRDDKQVVALQAADLVAGQIRRKAEFPLEPRPALNLITSQGCEKLDQSFLAEILDRLAMGTGGAE
jgi:hypothetical protein